MERLRVGVIGLGGRGYGMLTGEFLRMEDVDITAVCDVYPDRCERAVAAVEAARGNTPFSTTNYHEVLDGGYCDAVYIATAWEFHAEISVAAMRAGVPCGVEVGGAYDLEECYAMVRAYEETQTPFMFMENCCYNKAELLVTSMARAGKFGTVVHCHGAYAHHLSDEITGGNVNRHYRLRNYMNRNCENYPTHELGPIAKLLNINRGNRMVSLVAMSSKSVGLEEYVNEHKDTIDPTLIGKKWAQGDIVTTIIKCAGGETITLKLDTTLPRFYNREFTVQGTKGLYEMGPNMVFLEGMKESFNTSWVYREYHNNAADFEEEFLPKIWKDMTEEQKKGGHGGMDALMLREFVNAVKDRKPMPIDVYDGASWMAITALSERSIALGGAPQEIPDFTHGNWLVREPKDVVEM